MKTPHIEATSCEDFGKTVLMPGDPLRAEYIAKTYLTDVKRVNAVRNMFGFTGYYKGKKVERKVEGSIVKEKLGRGQALFIEVE